MPSAMQDNPVIASCAQCLVHVPDLVRYGSKPRREILKDPATEERLDAARRSFAEAVRYPPNQAFIGNIDPGALGKIPRPWYEATEFAGDATAATGPFGEIVPQDLFHAVLRSANVLTPPLVELAEESRSDLEPLLRNHPVFADFPRLGFAPATAIEEELQGGTSLPLRTGDALRGCVRRDDRAEGREDENLDACTLLEALSTKASGAIALKWLLHRAGLAAGDIDFVISCGEEAAGDRYQRGGGGVAKSIAQMCGCSNASGMDIKNFCAGPASALVTAGALVKAGLYRRVAVVAGGSLAKLGMKYQAYLKLGLPVLGDCLGAAAFLVTADDGESPVLHLEPGAVGTASVGASASDETVYRKLVLAPLETLGLGMGDVDKYAPELHNPEIMEHSGSGDVAHKNYRMLAALAVMAGEIDRSDMPAFMEKIGMTGFAPPQGHIPSAIPYMGHALAAMRRGDMRRALFICKASLFLNRLTDLYDGVSFLLEANVRAATPRTR